LSNNSSQHHYLPQFYLKGFTNKEGTYYVFDKRKKIIHRNAFHPSQTFFEWNRNTLVLGNYKSDLLESRIYKYIDNQDAQFYHSIQSSNRFTNIDNIVRIGFHQFVAGLYWRVPRADAILKKLFATSTYQELGFQIIDKATGKPNMEASLEMMRTPEFMEMYRPLLNDLQLRQWKVPATGSPWQIGYAVGPDTPNICTDDPILFRDPANPDTFHTDFIFPISRDKTLYFSPSAKLIKEFAAGMREKIDVLLFSQAEAMVCSISPDYLRYLHYESQNADLNMYRKEVFSSFD
jgi:hypothetical protein